MRNPSEEGRRRPERTQEPPAKGGACLTARHASGALAARDWNADKCAVCMLPSARPSVASRVVLRLRASARESSEINAWEDSAKSSKLTSFANLRVLALPIEAYMTAEDQKDLSQSEHAV